MKLEISSPPFEKICTATGEDELSKTENISQKSEAVRRRSVQQEEERFAQQDGRCKSAPQSDISRRTSALRSWRSL